jgi:hypothetical protein
MTTTAPSAARATIQPVFTDADANRVQSLAVDEDIGAFRVQHLTVGKVHVPWVWSGYQLSGIVVRQA